MKIILEKLNQEFQGGIEFNTPFQPMKRKEHGSNVKIDAYTQIMYTSHLNQNKA